MCVCVCVLSHSLEGSKQRGQEAANDPSSFSPPPSLCACPALPPLPPLLSHTKSLPGPTWREPRVLLLQLCQPLSRHLAQLCQPGRERHREHDHNDQHLVVRQGGEVGGGGKASE